MTTTTGRSTSAVQWTRDPQIRVKIHGSSAFESGYNNSSILAGKKETTDTDEDRAGR